MNFSTLEDSHISWRGILPIGRTVERDGVKCHIVGMTLAEEARLYIIEPFTEPPARESRGARNQRRLYREQDSERCCYLDCSEICIGRRRLKVQGAESSPLKYSEGDHGVVQMFMDMMSAGWAVPGWLKNTDWDGLLLVTLKLADLNRLPVLTPETPITVTHKPRPARHLLERPVTLRVGQCRSFYFVDSYGEKVWCHINNVTLIDVWKDTEEQLKNPRLAEKLTPEQLEQAKKHMADARKQSCPEGMCYVGVEYECEKDLNLKFYSKEFLGSRIQSRGGSSSFLLMRLKPDREKGTHGLPLKGDVIDTPFSPDTVKITAELFSYYENVEAWSETIYTA